MTASGLEFWFDFGSTYSYLSASRIEGVAAEAGVRVSWEPLLLGPIFREQGWNDSPFNVYVVKGRYMWRDMERMCDAYNIPFERPSRFPRNGLLAARVACLHELTPHLPEFVRAVFRANFAEDREISEDAEIADILDSLGMRGTKLVEDAKSAENKLRLRTQTERARANGIFGAPSFLADGELFWGDDRLEQAVAWLETHAVIGEAT